MTADTHVLLREMAGLREAVAQLRCAILRWRKLYQGSVRRCAELEAMLATFEAPSPNARAVKRRRQVVR